MNASMHIRMNPALWLLVAAAAAAFLESFALLVLYRASDRLRDHVAGAFRWLVHPFTGADGRPSWTKLMDLLVLGAYWQAAPLPAGVGYALIASAHGTKVLLALIGRMSVTASDVTNFSRQVTRSEKDERTVNINRTEQVTLDGRDAALGIDPSKPVPDPGHTEAS